MTELYYEPNSNPARVKSGYRKSSEIKKNPGTARKWIFWTSVIVFWGLLVFGSFTLANHYIGNIQQQLEQIQQTNQANVDDLNKKLETMQLSMNEHQEQALQLQQQFSVVESELEAVKEEMSLAGDTLNTSDETKQALSTRITDLSKELGELRKLIKKLEEAARVY